jgi:hypothetical protein
MPQEQQAYVRTKIASRLTPLKRSEELLPFRKAHSLTRCALFWIPVQYFPIPSAQRTWLLTFFDRFVARIAGQHQLRVEQFLQYKTVPDVLAAFMKTSKEFSPLMGLTRRPGAPLQRLPSKEELKAAVESGKDVDLKNYMPDYAYWFSAKLDHAQRETFFGFGGLTALFMPPDPNTQPPPLPMLPEWFRRHPFAQSIDLSKALGPVFALQDEFLRKSKTLFGADLENEPSYPGLPYIIPLLSSQDLIQAPTDECKKWFELFRVYVNESPADKGIIIAAQEDIEPDIIDVLQAMRAEDLLYPES